MSQPWTIRIGDLEVSEESITAAEAVDVERLAGAGWDSLNPLAGPACLSAIVTTLLVTRGGAALDDALDAVRSMSAGELLGLVSVAEREPAVRPG